MLTGGIESTPDRAMTAAAGNDIFLGDGQRLFEHLGVGNPRLAHVATVAAPGVTHLKFERA